MRSLTKRSALVLVVVLGACGGSSSGTVTTGSSTTAGPFPSSTALVDPSTTTVNTPTTPGPPRTPKTGPLTTPTTARRTDSYLPPGVVDQVFPPGTKAYELLTTGRCGPLLRQIRGPITPAEEPTTVAWEAGKVPASLTNLYVAAGEACLANWVPARAAFQKVKQAELCPTDPAGTLLTTTTSSKSAADCRDTRNRVYQWTESLLKAHDANPAFVPNFKPPPTR